MTKDQILQEIRRTAAANGGIPLGRERFLAETGIRESDWHGKFWVRWGEALQEAGFSPNELNRAYENDEVLSRLAAYVGELGHFPVSGELKLKRRSDPSFPSAGVFDRLGSKAELVAALADFATRQGNTEVVNICNATAPRRTRGEEEVLDDRVEVGHVYLVQHGSRRHFKIGRTNNPIRREGEVSGALPEKLTPVHTITTDDPVGVELYWHRRFASQRLQNEWFELSSADVRAFRRWRKIF